MNRVNINSKQLKLAMRNQNHKPITMPYAQQDDSVHIKTVTEKANF